MHRISVAVIMYNIKMKQTIVIASSNPGKLHEFQKLFAALPYQFIPQSEFSIPDADETGTTFLENALLKARHAAKISGLPSIADDSGLIVDALNGAPGVYSARYAGDHGNDLKNNEKLLTELIDVPTEKRHAHFHCCLVLVRNADDTDPIIASADWHGMIAEAPRGNNGFGYNPVFYLPNYQCTVAELSDELKNQLSHRAQAMEILKEKMKAAY
jgi:XTP/dITP diphosphohydrolase